MLGCHAAGVTSEVNLGFHYMQATEHTSKGINPAFETQGRRRQKSKQWYQWPNKKD